MKGPPHAAGSETHNQLRSRIANEAARLCTDVLASDDVHTVEGARERLDELAFELSSVSADARLATALVNARNRLNMRIVLLLSETAWR